MKAFGNIAKDGQVRAVASGALTNGKPICVNTDGTVSEISQTAASLGTEGAFNSLTSSFLSTVFDSSNNKHIITYRQGSSIRYVVATVASDGGVSFGTDAQAVSGDYSKIASAFDSTNNRIVIVFKNGATYAMVGSLSGTTVTWGSVTEVHSTSASDLAISFDSTAGKVVIVYRGASNYGRARVGTVSGTSISFGTEVVFNSGTTSKPRCAYDSTNNRTVVSYGDGDDSAAQGTAIVGTVSGTDISFGTEVEYEAGTITHSGIAFDSDTGKVVIAYRQNASSGGSTTQKRGTAIVGTVSGTGISFGTAVAFDNTGDYGENTANSVIYDSNAKKVLVVYPRTLDGSYSNRGHVFPLAVSGTTVVADTPTAFSGTATAVYPAISFDSNVNKNLIAFGDSGNSEYGTAVSFVPLLGNITSENFIGFSDGAFATTQSASINTANTIDRNQSSLTAGQTYFVQANGTLGTSAGSPSVTAGTAISATELIVKG